MKGLLCISLAMLAGAALGDGFTSVQVNGNSYSNISRAYAGSNGKIIILFPAGGTTAAADSLPADFLKSWGINADGAKAAAALTAENNLDKAIRAGCFREIDGMVYDIRRPECGWVSFSNVKVVQILEAGAIADSTPNVYETTPIFVKGLSASVGDTDFIAFTGKPSGSYSYVNQAGDDRTIRAYDLGRICERSEIPESVLKGQKAYDLAATEGAPQTDVVAKLPDSENLKASGSGFFISADGYLVTNKHVVKGSNRLKVKTTDGVFSAEVVRIDETDDLALLKVAGHFSPLGISTNEVELGDSVFTIGFPDIDLQGTQPKYTDGKISSLMGIKDDPNEYQISVPVQPGNSGGPLVDRSGRVCGVVVARLNDFAALRSMGGLPQNVNYALKGSLLRSFLSRGDEVVPVPGSSADGGNSVAAVQKSVAIVLVY